jgi:hypothetical protein
MAVVNTPEILNRAALVQAYVEHGRRTGSCKEISEVSRGGM